MSQCRERSEHRKNQQFGINENYWYLLIISNIFRYVPRVHVQT